VRVMHLDVWPRFVEDILKTNGRNLVFQKSCV